jgi:hypothetical protein
MSAKYIKHRHTYHKQTYISQTHFTTHTLPAKHNITTYFDLSHNITKTHDFIRDVGTVIKRFLKCTKKHEHTLRRVYRKHSLKYGTPEM